MAINKNNTAAGIVLYAKQPGLTSFTALNVVKKALGTKKVGHTGTLDSFADGLLVVLVGRLTRLVPHITLFDKTYQGEFSLFFDTKATYKDIRELDEELGDEIPDLVVDGKIDLGDITIEQVALLIDDYPRQEGEVFNFVSEFDEETTNQANPFNILKKLKK